MNLLLLRHGSTPGNAKQQYIGRTDEPLSPAGRAALFSSPEFSSIQTVYITPLRRTAETARLLFPNAQAFPVPDLREMDFGDFEGRSWRDMAEDAAYRAWVDGGCLSACPHGESLRTFTERVCAAFVTLVQRHITSGAPDPLVIVAHGGTIMAALSRFASPHKSYFDWSVANGCGFRLRAAFTADRLHLTVIETLRCAR